MPLSLFVGILIILFLLSRRVTRLLSHLFVRLFRSQHAAIYALSFIFLPGVVLHELSHLLLANILFVPTGEVEFFPEIQGDQVKMGSVAIARTDPLRRFLVGVAPVIGGLGIILLASTYLFTTLLSWQSLVLFYIIFEIANTMFSSSKDMEGAVGLLIGLAALSILLQFLGLPLWQVVIQFLGNEFVNSILIRMNLFLLLALGLDVFLVLLFEGIARLK